MKKCGRFLRRTALAAFFAVLLTAAFFAYVVFGRETGTLSALLWGVFFACGFLWAGERLRRMADRAAEKVFSAALVGMAALYLLVSVWFMHTYRYTPLWDPDAVFTGAQSWLNGSLTATGSPTYDAATYFYYFPNNLGATFVLRGWFRLTGGMDPYIAACALNSLLSAGMIVCTGLAAKETGGAKAGAAALMLLGCTLPIWFSSAAFYTDFLSICFPVGSYWLALKADRAGSIRKKAALWAACGLMAALGAMIKITVLILPIGVVLWQALRGRWRDALGIALAAALLFGAGQIVLSESVYPDQLDPDTAERMNTPVQHWIMMGLRGDGYYNGSDYDFTRSFATAEEAKEAINAEIGARLRKMGAVGLAEHMFRKMGVCISDGTLMLSDYYDDYPVAPEWLKALLLPGGGAYGLWRAVCGGVHMAQIALALAGALRQFKSGGGRLAGAKYLCLLGLLLFLSMWETSKRYWINFMPLLVLCAADGAMPLPRKKAV